MLTLVFFTAFKISSVLYCISSYNILNDENKCQRRQNIRDFGGVFCLNIANSLIIRKAVAGLIIRVAAPSTLISFLKTNLLQVLVRGYNKGDSKWRLWSPDRNDRLLLVDGVGSPGARHGDRGQDPVTWLQGAATSRLQNLAHPLPATHRRQRRFDGVGPLNIIFTEFY